MGAHDRSPGKIVAAWTVFAGQGIGPAVLRPVVRVCVQCEPDTPHQVRRRICPNVQIAGRQRGQVQRVAVL